MFYVGEQNMKFNNNIIDNERLKIAVSRLRDYEPGHNWHKKLQSFDGDSCIREATAPDSS